MSKILLDSEALSTFSMKFVRGPQTFSVIDTIRATDLYGY